jgi:hypothetical protein
MRMRKMFGERYVERATREGAPGDRPPASKADAEQSRFGGSHGTETGFGRVRDRSFARSAGEQRRPTGRDGQVILTGTAADNVGKFLGAPRTSILADTRGGPENTAGLSRDGGPVRVEDNPRAAPAPHHAWQTDLEDDDWAHAGD